MKPLKFIVLCVCVLSMTQCKNKQAQEDQPLDVSDLKGDVLIQAFSAVDGSPIQTFSVVRDDGTVPPQVSHVTDGQFLAQNINVKDMFDIEGKDFRGQSMQFIEFKNLTKLRMFFKENTTDLNSTAFKGAVYSGDNPASGIIVSCGDKNTTTDDHGNYLLNLQRPGPYNMVFSNLSNQVRFSLGADQDTVIVDVYIDGLSDDNDAGKMNK